MTAGAEKSFRRNVEGIELLILAGLSLLTATVAYLGRRSTRSGDHFPLRDARRAPSPVPSPTLVCAPAPAPSPISVCVP
ncbi:hypothetical protein AB0F36_28155 [Streptomyces sp. NPDC029080]|uniref:hypothetical protein n=1 Tax=Streptomyces sp. NPDC029080 TaxID=3155017 RepID=UPI0033D89917